MSGQQRIHEPWNCYRSQSAVNVCYVRLFYGVQTVLSVWPPHEKIVREAPGGRVNGPFLQLIFGVCHAFIDTVVQVKCAAVQCG